MQSRRHAAPSGPAAALRPAALAHALGLAAAMACTPTASVVPAASAAATPIPLAEARAHFAQASALCSADNSALWQVSLCGPIMLVDGATRFVVANQADARGLLRPDAGVFVGTLPTDQNIANTAVDWAGVRWVLLGWPLPADPATRAVVMMHEMFHRIAPRIGAAKTSTPDNVQLATLEGRYQLQLEWRALAAALRATTEAQRRTAVADALAFRRARRAAHPRSAASEDALEIHEGLAEYTGVVVGRPTERVPAALQDLAAHVDDPSFVRSFAYATGPAYGLLLDRYVPGWRSRVGALQSLSETLATAVPPAAEGAAASYDGPALRASEQARAKRIAVELASYRRALVDGPVLRLGFREMKIGFNPNTVQPLDHLGSIYPSLRVVDVWGVLEVTGGALITADWTSVVVSAPLTASPVAQPVVGEGWRLVLTPGWRLVPGERPGDLQLAPSN